MADVSGGREDSAALVLAWIEQTQRKLVEVGAMSEIPAGGRSTPTPDEKFGRADAFWPARPPVGDTTGQLRCKVCQQPVGGAIGYHFYKGWYYCLEHSPTGGVLSADTTQPQPTDEPPDSVCDVCHGAKRIYWAGDSTECSTCEGTGSIPSGQKRFRVWMTREESARIDAVFGAVAEIRALHRQADGGFACSQCIAQDYPCATVRALNEAGCL